MTGRSIRGKIRRRQERVAFNLRKSSSKQSKAQKVEEGDVTSNHGVCEISREGFRSYIPRYHTEIENSLVAGLVQHTIPEKRIPDECKVIPQRHRHSHS